MESRCLHSASINTHGDLCTANGKVLCITWHEGPEGEKRYSSTLYLTSALDGGGWSTPCPSRFTPAVKSLSNHFTSGWVGLRAHRGSNPEPSGTYRFATPTAPSQPPPVYCCIT